MLTPTGDATEAFVVDLPPVAHVLETASLSSDLLRWALGQVNWREIRDALCEP